MLLKICDRSYDEKEFPLIKSIHTCNFYSLITIFAIRFDIFNLYSLNLLKWNAICVFRMKKTTNEKSKIIEVVKCKSWMKWLVKMYSFSNERIGLFFCSFYVDHNLNVKKRCECHFFAHFSTAMRLRRARTIKENRLHYTFIKRYYVPFLLHHTQQRNVKAFTMFCFVQPVFKHTVAYYDSYVPCAVFSGLPFLPWSNFRSWWFRAIQPIAMLKLAIS